MKGIKTVMVSLAALFAVACSGDHHRAKAVAPDKGALEKFERSFISFACPRTARSNRAVLSTSAKPSNHWKISNNVA